MEKSREFNAAEIGFFFKPRFLFAKVIISSHITRAVITTVTSPCFRVLTCLGKADDLRTFLVLFYSLPR